MKMKSFFVLILVLFFSINSLAKDNHLITVAQNGSGDFKTISEAVQSLPMFNYERIIIYIKNGIYNEKFKIDQDYIALKGESRDSTIIQYSQLRSDWEKNKDSIGPAVINISGEDIIFKNLTIENTQPEIGPHAFAIYGTGTRTIIINCNVWSKGADTVSLWDHKTGMYYHANCDFRGSVDFVCPRGWCFIKNSKFYEEKKTAALWHAGGENINQKFVLKNCSFDGVKGFELGRHHYEAQFYLLNCSFSENLSDKPIYRVTYPDQPERNRPFNWGKRDYFYNCNRDEGNYSWFKNNLDSAKNSPSPEEITSEWTFDGKWDPESSEGPKIINYEIYTNVYVKEHGFILFIFNEHLTVIGKPILKSNSGIKFIYDSGAGSDTLRFNCNSEFSKEDLTGIRIENNSKILGNTAAVIEREVSFNLQ